jgi:1-acyl-sn-glycerol-3-phosphate acyltransferase
MRHPSASALRLLAPWRRLASPAVMGLEHIPHERPLLFVGNHTLYGLLDAPLMIAELYERRRIFLRALGDHVHFKVPLWGALLSRFGVVDGTPERCAELMRAGAAILVFPGGAREVAKRKGERHQLIWKERLGFVRLAVAHGCTIVPFASIGVEDSLDIVLDADELLASPLGRLLGRLPLRTDAIFPLVRGIGPTPLPRPERIYFSFAPPIATVGRDGSTAGLRALRDEVRAAVEGEIARLERARARDPDRPLGRRLGKLLRGRLARSPSRPA